MQYMRKADYKGTVRVDKHHYYVGKELAGKYVQAEVDGTQGQLVFWSEQREVKRVAIKGLIGMESRKLCKEEELAEGKKR